MTRVPSSMHCGQAILYNSSILYGGGDGDNKRRIIKFDLSQKKWEEFSLYLYESFSMSVVQGKLLVVGGYDAVKDEYSNRVSEWERERVQLGQHTGEPFTDSQIRCRQHRLQEVVDSGWWFQWRSTGQSGHFELRDVRPVALAEHAPPTTHVCTPVDPLPKPDKQRGTVVPRQHEQGVWPKRTETSVLHLQSGSVQHQL